jgi:hypothetical protein
MSLSSAAKANGVSMGRISFAVGLIGMACQHFFFEQFAPIVVPPWPASMPGRTFGSIWWRPSLWLAGHRSCRALRRALRPRCWEGCSLYPLWGHAGAGGDSGTHLLDILCGNRADCFRCGTGREGQSVAGRYAVEHDDLRSGSGVSHSTSRCRSGRDRTRVDEWTSALETLAKSGVAFILGETLGG